MIKFFCLFIKLVFFVLGLKFIFQGLGAQPGTSAGQTHNHEGIIKKVWKQYSKQEKPEELIIL